MLGKASAPHEWNVDDVVVHYREEDRVGRVAVVEDNKLSVMVQWDDLPEGELDFQWADKLVPYQPTGRERPATIEWTLEDNTTGEKKSGSVYLADRNMFNDPAFWLDAQFCDYNRAELFLGTPIPHPHGNGCNNKTPRYKFTQLDVNGKSILEKFNSGKL